MMVRAVRTVVPDRGGLVIGGVLVRSAATH